MLSCQKLIKFMDEQENPQSNKIQKSSFGELREYMKFIIDVSQCRNDKKGGNQVNIYYKKSGNQVNTYLTEI